MFEGSAIRFGAGDPYMYCFNERDQRQTFIPHPSPKLCKIIEERMVEQAIRCFDKFFALSIFLCAWVIKADDSPYR
ncbi:MAG: hypothetical protein PHO79_01345 [Desulfoplanes sp.]|nr:hypothetical protein [Desulfoplanes sp.]MDD4648655.1 hypothetical protein [Desulfoplanes sp.]